MSNILGHIEISSNGPLEEHKSSSFGWTFCTDWFACVYEFWTFIPDFYIQNNKHKCHHVTDCHVEFHLTTFLPLKPNTPQQPTTTTKNQIDAHNNNNITTPANHEAHTNQKLQTEWQQRCQICCRQERQTTPKRTTSIKDPPATGTIMLDQTVLSFTWCEVCMAPYWGPRGTSFLSEQWHHGVIIFSNSE